MYTFTIGYALSVQYIGTQPPVFGGVTKVRSVTPHFSLAKTVHVAWP